MKLGFNQATTLENSNLATDIDLCEQHGYDYIEIRTMDKLPEYLEQHSLDQLAEYFKEHHIKPLALNALVYFNNRSNEDYQELLNEFKQMLDYADKLQVPYIVVVPLVTKDKILKKDIKASSVDVLNELAGLAEPYGIKLALEFVGHPECTINTFEQAYDIIQTVDNPNVGLVLDCFHFHAMGSGLEALKQADASKIFILHMDDTEDFPIGNLVDEDRVWPGHGAIDLEGILYVLKEKEFDGPVTVELFRPEYYEMKAEDVIRKAKETTVEVVSRYL
ncbi:sugar phosphate isomerase/epimerase family protein [Terribacillus saccharophilus]|uniref:sugar phosphate isomerase/epimerase family protein n=1 Tax=Terribacillus saccharophilus TaxID=361277 RepID=UPI002DC9FD66|nr:sugar phosphate isomerase/epimerase [Terribacillus saccharophilus]MEC0288960.1 sugar phosphate isomerase/epimerase [Terribacillus saccharophilus]